MAVKSENITESRPIVVEDDSQRHLKTVALRTYRGQEKQCVDNNRITDFLPMVHKIVQRVITYVRPPLSYEDLVSAGTIGLVKAARDYDPSHRAEFKTYAYIRIRGAVLDELRDWSFVPANLNKQIQNARRLSRKITEQTGTRPTDDELAEKLGIGIDKLYETFENARAQHFVSIDDFGEGVPALGNTLASANAVPSDEQIERAELVDRLAEAIQQLSDKKRQIILLYYQQQLTMKQIAEIFEVTESRVSQLHAGALFDLSVKLRQWKDGRE